MRRSDVKDLYELRAALSVSRSPFAQRATPSSAGTAAPCEQVDVLFNRLATSDEDPDFKFVVNSHHVQLHMMIAEHAGSRLLREMIDRNHVLILNWLFDVTGRRTALPAGFHARLADALVSGDPETADTAMRAHVRYGLNEISSHIRELLR